MAKKTYEIVVIKPGRDRDYWDFHDRNRQTNSAGEVLHSGLLSEVELIEASSKIDAIRKAYKQHPGCGVDEKASRALG